MDAIWNMGIGGIGLVLVVVVLASAFRILREYERGVVFTLGRFYKVKGPGWFSFRKTAT